MTEQEAKERWCPMVRVVPYKYHAGAADMRTGYESSRPDGKTTCIGSACMMWRETDDGNTDLTIYTSNVLRNAKVTPTQAAAMSDDELLRIPNLGRKVLNEVREKLREPFHRPSGYCGLAGKP